MHGAAQKDEEVSLGIIPKGIFPKIGLDVIRLNRRLTFPANEYIIINVKGRERLTSAANEETGSNPAGRSQTTNFLEKPP